MGKEWVLTHDPNTAGKLMKAGRQGRVLPTHPSHFSQVSLFITLVSDWENFDLKSQKSWDKRSKAHGRIFIVIPLLLPKAPTSIIAKCSGEPALRLRPFHFLIGWSCDHLQPQLCLSPQTQPDILLGGVSNSAHPEFSHTRGQTKVRRPRAGTLNALLPMVPDQVKQRECCPIQYCQGCCTLRP